MTLVKAVSTLKAQSSSIDRMPRRNMQVKKIAVLKCKVPGYPVPDSVKDRSWTVAVSPQFLTGKKK